MNKIKQLKNVKEHSLQKTNKLKMQASYDKDGKKVNEHYPDEGVLMTKINELIDRTNALARIINNSNS